LTFKNHQYYNCKIQLDTGQTYFVDANWLHNTGLDTWHGWSCDAGYKRIEIDANFNVASGECKNDKLGNLLDTWDLLSSPTTCYQSTCSGCADDLIIGKRKSNNTV
jgi:hypothetical protein